MSTTVTKPVAMGIRRIALAGNPNAGKTTIFNGLTGMRQKVANYPGVTVEKKIGRVPLPSAQGWLEILDLPGTYSLEANSPDEAVAADVLRGNRADTPAPDVIIVVVDASNLARNCYLVSQLIELGKPVVIALNMMDVAKRRGLGVDPAALSAAIGVPVIPLIGHRRDGIPALIAAVGGALDRVTPPVWPLPEAMWQELHHLGELVAKVDGQQFPRTTTDDMRTSPAVVAARRILSGETGRDLAPLYANPELKSALSTSTTRLAEHHIDPMQADIEGRYRWIDGVVSAAVSGSQVTRRLTERLDAIFLHPVAGLLAFTAIMAALFVSIFTLAGPLMDSCEGFVTWIGALAFGGLGEGPLKSLLLDGIVAGLGAVVVFVPQIALLFLFLALLEDSGYLARAAFLMDRLLSKVGLHGKSFIPLLSSFACAIPGVMAARTIDSRRERLATILVAPFMSCSARLPVYALLIGAFFAASSPVIQGGILLGCYLLGILAAATIGWAFGLRARQKGDHAGTFILELPTYKTPQASLVAWQVWNGTKAFLLKAGTTIFCLTVLIWAASSYPKASDADRAAATAQAEAQIRAKPETPEMTADPSLLDATIAAARRDAEAQTDLEHSVAGRIGHAIEPAIAPLGFDWKMGVGLVGAFAAREVFNSTLAVIYNLGEREADDVADLSTAIRDDVKADGTPVWRPLTAISMLVWFVLAMQCISTTAVVKRETGGWTWPLIQLVGMNAIAYVCCLIVYQVGLAMGY